jgi:myosin V
LLTEKEAYEATRKTLTEAQEKSGELLKKIHNNDKHILQLQFTIQRYIIVARFTCSNV